MDLSRFLTELREELAQIDQAILALESLARGGGKRRGRPPKALAEIYQAEPSQPAPRKKRVVSAETRAKMAAAQRRRRQAAAAQE